MSGPGVVSAIPSPSAGDLQGRRASCPIFLIPNFFSSVFHPWRKNSLQKPSHGYTQIITDSIQAPSTKHASSFLPSVFHPCRIRGLNGLEKTSHGYTQIFTDSIQDPVIIAFLIRVLSVSHPWLKSIGKTEPRIYTDNHGFEPRAKRCRRPLRRSFFNGSRWRVCLLNNSKSIKR